MCTPACIFDLSGLSPVSVINLHLETLEDVTSSLDQGHGVDIIFLDYAKAFDSLTQCPTGE